MDAATIDILTKLGQGGVAAVYLGAIVVLWRQNIALNGRYEALLVESTKQLTLVGERLADVADRLKEQE